MAVMADGFAQMRVTSPTFNKLYAVGKELRTKKLQTKLQEALDSDSKSPGFVPIDIPQDQDDLARAMKLFENEVCDDGLVINADRVAHLSF
jgi:hypothetical protein